MMKCPICENEIEDYRVDYLEHTICEEYAKCVDEHHRYGYEYAYGRTEENVGRVTFHSHYSDSKELRELINKQYHAILELEKEHYKKSIGG